MAQFDEDARAAGNCGYTGTEVNHPCKLDEGWGTEFETGFCTRHIDAGGAPEENQNAVGNDGGGAPEGNTNRVSHGLFAEVNKFYQNVMTDTHRELCDQIYEDYLDEYTEINGAPIKGHKARMFEISVNHIKIIYSDNWAYDRPSELDSGSPMVDKETTYKTAGESVVQQDEYKPSIVTSTQQKLRREDRAWLREYGLLNDPESQKADALADVKAAWINDLTE